LKNAKAQRK